MSDVLERIEQGSDEWHELRLGKVTGSRIADVMAGGKGITRDKYMAQLVAERLTGKRSESYKSSAMEAGTETEPTARNMYSFLENVKVEEVAFVDHPDIEMCGASPDGLVGDAGLVEFKCPLVHTHIKTLNDGKVPGNYYKQMQWQMDCTDREWCDYVSFSPEMPAQMQMFIRRVHRDDELIEEIQEAVREFLQELDTSVQQLLKEYPRV